MRFLKKQLSLLVKNLNMLDICLLPIHKDQLEFDIQSQKNLKGFMKTLLDKKIREQFLCFPKISRSFYQLLRTVFRNLSKRLCLY